MISSCEGTDDDDGDDDDDGGNGKPLEKFKWHIHDRILLL